MIYCFFIFRFITPAILLGSGLLLLVVYIIYFKNKINSKISKRRAESDKKKVVVSFFHPYCNAGGGGERVLWVAIRSLQQKYENVKIIVYTGDVDATKEEILKKAKNTFNVVVDERNVEFVLLERRRWIHAEKYPYFTLLGQSLGSIWLGLEAVAKYPPDVFIDSMGYAFVYPIFKWFAGCKVACYTHYPTISQDMLKRVQSRQFSHNNRSIVVRNPFLTWLKLVYYRLFAKVCYAISCRLDENFLHLAWTN